MRWENARMNNCTLLQPVWLATCLKICKERTRETLKYFGTQKNTIITIWTTEMSKIMLCNNETRTHTTHTHAFVCAAVRGILWMWCGSLSIFLTYNFFRSTISIQGFEPSFYQLIQTHAHTRTHTHMINTHTHAPHTHTHTHTYTHTHTHTHTQQQSKTKRRERCEGRCEWKFCDLIKGTTSKPPPMEFRTNRHRQNVWMGLKLQH